MKPHEETWVVDEEALKEFGDCTATDVEGFAVLSTWSRGDLPNGDTIAEERLRLATAAPEMARMLLDLLKNYEIGEKVDGQLTTLLTKAGVLP